MQIFLTEHAGDCEFGALVHFYVESVDNLFEEFTRHAVPISEPPNDGIDPRVRSIGNPGPRRQSPEVHNSHAELSGPDRRQALHQADVPMTDLP
jgi:hypothetical protein